MSTFLESLACQEPLEPRGWFRWLHDHYAWRNGFLFAGRNGVLDEREARVRILEKHAWLAGTLEMDKLADSCWEDLSPAARGAFLAGLSEKEPESEEELERWQKEILARLDAAEFSAESLCQIACNAVRSKGSADLLAAVLKKGASDATPIRRSDAFNYPETSWPEMLVRLSSRGIDLVLEAALICGNEAAVNLALSHGADANIPIWWLERSFNEKHCALTFAIEQGQCRAVEALLAAGARVQGTDFVTPNLPLFLALHKGWDDFAGQLLDAGASFALPATAGEVADVHGGSESVTLHPRGRFFGHFPKELTAARRRFGRILPLVPVSEKAAFPTATARCTTFTTCLSAVIGDVPRLLRFEALGLDTRLSLEELCSAIDADAYDGLRELARRHGEKTWLRLLAAIHKTAPGFGTSGRHLEVSPRSDGLNVANDFDPARWPALSLPDGSLIHADLSAIAPPDHAHGPCLEGHFWLRQDDAELRREEERIEADEFLSRWRMVPMPENRYQIDNLLPAVRESGEMFVRLGISVGRLALVTPRVTTKNLLFAWWKSADFSRVLDEAEQRIRAQDAVNTHPPRPALTKDELEGYPPEFWPYLVRLENGLIGMTTESCAANPGIRDIYTVWTRQNKREDAFVPDPRVLDWEAWPQVPPELRPFFCWDPDFDRPGICHNAHNAYEKAMLRKATLWWNDWITPQILDFLEKSDPKTT